MLIFQDRNVQIGVLNEDLDDGELKDECIGMHGMVKRNAKGQQLIDFIHSNNLVALNTF